jgi:hypothetical protein
MRLLKVDNSFMLYASILGSFVSQPPKAAFGSPPSSEIVQRLKRLLGQVAETWSDRFACLIRLPVRLFILMWHIFSKQELWS